MLSSEAVEPEDGGDAIVFSGGMHVRAPVEIVRDHLLARSLFQADALGFPLSPDGYDRVFVQGELVTIEGRIVLAGRSRLLSGSLVVEEPCRLSLSGVLHETGEDPEERGAQRYRRRFGRVVFELLGRPDWSGTEVSFRFELVPERRLFKGARKRLEGELGARVRANTLRGLSQLKGLLERELTAPRPPR
ncbi:MAG: hypothetical protein KGI89_08985 [Euryarchaeota archaeon]|nr:hypothetical protein [Euryarchaeota archaeon]